MKLYVLVFFTGISVLVFGQTKQDRQIMKQVDKAILDQYNKITPGCAVLIAKLAAMLKISNINSYAS